MNEDPFKNKQEQVPVVVRMATEDDWEELANLRIMSIRGGDAEMFGVKPGQLDKELSRTPEQWKKEFFGNDRFTIVSFVGSRAVGMARATMKNKDWWHVGWLYVKDGLKGQKIVESLQQLD
jgi:hypothetical protein